MYAVMTSITMSRARGDPVAGVGAERAREQRQRERQNATPSRTRPFLNMPGLALTLDKGFLDVFGSIHW